MRNANVTLEPTALGPVAARNTMTTNLESGTSAAAPARESRAFNWLKVGMVAAGSAIAGGMAASWFYRNTLTRLRQAESEALDGASNTSSEISEGDE